MLKKVEKLQVRAFVLTFAILLVIALRIFTSLTKVTGNEYFSHLQPSPDATSDRTAALQLVWYFSKMSFPWSSTTYLNFPEGESIFRWQEITQFLQVGILFLLSKCCSPSVAVSLLTFVGLSLSCFSLYRLTKVLTNNRIAGTLTPILFMLSPYSDRIISTHTSESFLGLSVLPLSYAIELRHKNDLESFIKINLAVLLIAFVDGYYFLFSLFALFILFFSQLARNFVRRRKNSKYLIISLLVLVTDFMLVKIISRYLEKRGSANSQVPSIETILSHKADTNSIWLGNIHTLVFGEYLTYRPIGPIIGVIPLGLTLMGVIRFRHKLFDVALVTVVFQVMGSYSSLTSPLTKITSILKNLFPGVLYYSRFTHVVFCLTICMFVFTIHQSLQYLNIRLSKTKISDLRKKIVVALVATLLGSLVMYDWSGDRDRFKYYVQERPSEFQFLSLKIAGQGTAIFPLDILGRSHIEQFYLQTSLINSKKKPEQLQAIWDRARTTNSLKKELVSHNVDFLILFSRKESLPSEYVFSWQKDEDEEVMIDLPELEMNRTSKYLISLYDQMIYIHLFDLRKSDVKSLG